MHRIPLKKALIFFITTLFCAQQTFTLNVVFDVGDVLIETDRSAVFKEIGFKALAYYLVMHPCTISNMGPHLQSRLFRFLNKALPRKTDEAQARDEQGRLVPQIMCDWLKGTKTNSECLAYLRATMRNHPEYFASAAEKNLINRVITMMFTPAKFAQTRRLIPEMAKIAHECHARGDKLYILSNWDAQTFELVKQKNAKLFALFDGIVTSGECHALKPAPEPYIYLLEKYTLNPADTVFIDDQEINLKTGQDLGIRGIACKRSKANWYSPKATNVEQIREQLLLTNQSAPAVNLDARATGETA